MIRIKNVTKDYGSNKGVFDLSFEVQDQETFGLLGMEGAGKTTLLQILMGFSNLSGDAARSTPNIVGNKVPVLRILPDICRRRSHCRSR